MLQVIEEYIDGGYVYTVKDTNQFDEEQAVQLADEGLLDSDADDTEDDWCHYSGMPSPDAYKDE